MDDPMVSKEDVPSYEKVEEKIKQFDGTIMILRVFYLFDRYAYRFQLLKNNKMSMVDIPKNLLDGLKDGNPELEEDLTELLRSSLKDTE